MSVQLSSIFLILFLIECIMQYLEVKQEGQRPIGRPTMIYHTYIERLGQDCGKGLWEMKIVWMDWNRWRRWMEAPYDLVLRGRRVR